jgi:hypothetical protein
MRINSRTKRTERDRKQERRQQPDVPTPPIAPAWLIGRTGTVAPLFGQTIFDSSRT